MPQSAVESSISAENQSESPIRVYIANLGKYNEGELVGGWLDLPKTRKEIDEFLTDTVGIELDAKAAYEKGLAGERVYEEYAIHDWEFSEDLKGLGTKINEYSRLDTVSALALLIEQADDFALDTLKAYNSEIASTDPIEAASVLAHFAEGEYPDGVYSYTKDSNNSDEVAYAEYLLDEVNIDLGNKIKEFKMEHYFDYAAYGKDMAQDGYLHDGIYIDGDSNLYEWVDDMDIAEIKETICDTYDPFFFLTQAQIDQAGTLNERGWDFVEENCFRKEFSLASDKPYCVYAEYNSEAQAWEAWVYDITAQKTGDVSGYPTLEEAVKTGEEIIAEVRADRERDERHQQEAPTRQKSQEKTPDNTLEQAAITGAAVGASIAAATPEITPKQDIAQGLADAAAIASLEPRQTIKKSM